MPADHGEEWNGFVANLVRQAVQMLRPQTRPVVDPEDVVASALASFFAAQKNMAAGDGEHMMAFLLDAVRRHCEKWNMRSRRHPSISYQAAQAVEPASPLTEAEQTQAFDELVESVAQDLIDREKAIFLMLIEGRTVADISQRLGCVERTVRRCRKKIVARVQALP